MKCYLDTSSLVKIYHDERGSSQVLDMYRSDKTIRVSELAVLELLSTLSRKHREGEIDLKTLEAVWLKFQEDIETRFELLLTSSLVFEEAVRLLQQYGPKRAMRTLDSIQLGFFLAYCELVDTFVCADHKLIAICLAEKIKVFVPDELKG